MKPSLKSRPRLCNFFNHTATKPFVGGESMLIFRPRSSTLKVLLVGYLGLLTQPSYARPFLHDDQNSTITDLDETENVSRNETAPLFQFNEKNPLYQDIKKTLDPIEALESLTEKQGVKEEDVEVLRSYEELVKTIGESRSKFQAQMKKLERFEDKISPADKELFQETKTKLQKYINWKEDNDKISNRTSSSTSWSSLVPEGIANIAKIPGAVGSLAVNLSNEAARCIKGVCQSLGEYMVPARVLSVKSLLGRLQSMQKKWDTLKGKENEAESEKLVVEYHEVQNELKKLAQVYGLDPASENWDQEVVKVLGEETARELKPKLQGELWEIKEKEYLRAEREKIQEEANRKINSNKEKEARLKQIKQLENTILDRIESPDQLGLGLADEMSKTLAYLRNLRTLTERSSSSSSNYNFSPATTPPSVTPSEAPKKVVESQSTPPKLNQPEPQVGKIITGKDSNLPTGSKSAAEVTERSGGAKGQEGEPVRRAVREGSNALESNKNSVQGVGREENRNSAYSSESERYKDSDSRAGSGKGRDHATQNQSEREDSKRKGQALADEGKPGKTTTDKTATSTNGALPKEPTNEGQTLLSSLRGMFSANKSSSSPEKPSDSFSLQDKSKTSEEFSPEKSAQDETKAEFESAQGEIEKKTSKKKDKNKAAATTSKSPRESNEYNVGSYKNFYESSYPSNPTSFGPAAQPSLVNPLYVPNSDGTFSYASTTKGKDPMNFRKKGVTLNGSVVDDGGRLQSSFSALDEMLLEESDVEKLTKVSEKTETNDETVVGKLGLKPAVDTIYKFLSEIGSSSASDSKTDVTDLFKKDGEEVDSNGARKLASPSGSKKLFQDKKLAQNSPSFWSRLMSWLGIN